MALQVTYVLSDNYSAAGIAGASVNYGAQQEFDILPALVAGGGDARGRGGSFIVTNAQLIDALNHHPAVKISGTVSVPDSGTVAVNVQAKLPPGSQSTPFILDLTGAVIGQALGVDGKPLSPSLTVTINPTIITLSRVGTLAVATGAVPVPITAGLTGKSIVRMRAMVGTAPTGQALNFRVNKNGSPVATGSIAAGATDSGAVTTAVGLTAGDRLTMDITQVGSTVAGSDLGVALEIT